VILGQDRSAREYLRVHLSEDLRGWNVEPNVSTLSRSVTPRPVDARDPGTRVAFAAVEC